MYYVLFESLAPRAVRLVQLEVDGGGDGGGDGVASRCGGLEAPVAEDPGAGGGVEFGVAAGAGDIHGGGEPLRGDGDADADAAGDAAAEKCGRIGWPRGMY